MVENILGWLAWTVLSGWYLATVAVNIPYVERLIGSRFASRRVWSFIPNWSFFAPRPAVSDTFLFYRDRLAGGTCSPWRTAAEPPKLHWLRRMAWNPHSRPGKAISDAESVLLQEGIAARSMAAESLFLTVPYLLLLNHVCSFAVGPGVGARQFALARRDGRSRQLEIVFVSGFHTLGDRQDAQEDRQAWT
ncbi:hypothetical protein AB0J71_23950 [Nonomuraea sp. NPDC049637]|uniref:hypothetical protein n=1 Tax=Nonomuraea sp. NPDC049637 TaxID=3154356 RepID=UPI003413979C